MHSCVCASLSRHSLSPCSLRRSLAKHGLDNNLVRHLVAVNEELVLKLLTQAEEADLCGSCPLFLHLFLIALLKVKALDLLNRAQVRAQNVLVAYHRVAYLDGDIFRLRSLLGFHSIHGRVNLIVVRRLNAADRHTIIDTC